MNQSLKAEIKRTILLELHKAWAHDTIISLFPLQEAHGWDEKHFWTAVDELEHHEGLIKNYGSSATYEMRPQGILYAEKQGYIPQAEAERLGDIRTRLLAALAEDYELHGSDSDATPDSLNLTGIASKEADTNLRLLAEIGYVRGEGVGYQITPRGLQAIADWKRKNALVDEFTRISEMAPAPRGRALQKFLARVMEEHGWSQQEGVRSAHEEMDVIVFRAREYFLIECKWEKEPIEAGVVRELFGKLGNRVDVKGIIVSMSGFTSGATTQVAGYAGLKVVLLFGPDDINSIVSQGKDFEDLLNEKYNALVTRREAHWL